MNKCPEHSIAPESHNVKSAEIEPVNVESAMLESVQLIDASHEVSVEVMFDKHGNVNLQRQNIDYAPTPAATVSYDDSILKHLDIDDLRIVESSQLKQVNTVSGKLELGHRRRNR